jgi:hypothetical protein
MRYDMELQAASSRDSISDSPTDFISTVGR